MRKQATILIMSSLLAGTALAPSALAQDASAEGDEVMSVYDRYRPDYNAPGIRTGSFLFYPSIDGVVKYDSNIFAQDKDAAEAGARGEVVGDVLAQIKPSFNLVSDWSSDYFRLFADADIAKYMDEGTEDYEDFTIGASGRKDISRGMSITADVSYREGHEDRGAPNANGNQVEPTTLSVFDAKLGFVRDVSVISLAVDGSYTRREFDNIANQGDTTSNNDRRNRDRMKIQARVGYELPSGYEAFIRGSIDRVEYDNSKQVAVLPVTAGAVRGPQRNSDGVEIVGGATFDITGKARGEVFVGYMERAYDSDTLGSTDGINFGAELLWNVSGLTSFTGSVKRSIDETVITDPDSGDASSGITSTLFSGRVEHELRRNVLLHANASYTRLQFELIDRDDDMFNVGAGARYLINRNLSAGVSYDYNSRSTEDSLDQDFTRHALMVNVTAKW